MKNPKHFNKIFILSVLCVLSVVINILLYIPAFVIIYFAFNFDKAIELLEAVIFISPYLIGLILAVPAFIYQMLFLYDAPMPEIQYAEFPFEIVYEVDGDLYKIKDTLVCELDGTEPIPLEIHSERELVWDTYFKSTEDNFISLGKTGGDNHLCIYIGDVDYYMFGKIRDDGYLPGEFFYVYPYSHLPQSFEKLEETYGIKIISTKFSEPLEENKCEYRTIDKIRKVISFPYQLGANVVLNIIEKSEEALIALQQ